MESGSALAGGSGSMSLRRLVGLAVIVIRGDSVPKVTHVATSVPPTSLSPLVACLSVLLTALRACVGRLYQYHIYHMCIYNL
jgi:hypothetical protein